MYRSSPFRSTLNTNVIKLWACVKYVAKQSFRSTLNTNVLIPTRQTGPYTGATGRLYIRKYTNTRNARLKHKARKREITKRENAKTRKPRKLENGENGEDGEDAKTRKRRKRENAKTAKRETAKTAKTRKPERENGESRKAVFAETIQSIKLAIKDARRWNNAKHENAKTRKRQKVFSFSGFLVFWFSRSAGRILLARSRLLCA